MIISNKDKLIIKQLIKESEKRIQGEIVPMITHHSDLYPAAHFRAAIILSFIFSIALYYSPLSIINPIYYLWIQIPGLYLGYYLAHFSFVKRLLITQSEMNQEVNQKAFEAFFHHNLHTTKHHTGILILVSVMERKIKIVADIGISKKVNQQVWDEIILEFTHRIQVGQFAEGLQESIQSVANVMESYFPSTGEKSNELGNDLIIENK